MRISTIVAVSVFVISYWGYHYIYLWFTEFRDIDTKMKRINRAIHSWFTSVLEERSYLLVVHQMRNLVMAVTFLATTIVILIGFLFGFSTLGNGGVPGGLILEGAPLWLIVITLIFSFLNLLLSLRHFIRISFLIRAQPEALGAITGNPPENYLTNLFIRGNRQYTIGRRGVLYSLVVLIWYLNIWVFVVTTILVTFAFAIHHDI